MAQQEALGRLINVAYPADNIYYSLKDCAGITFVGYEVTTASTITLTFSSDNAGGSTATPAVIDHYYGKTAATSGGVWHKTTMAAGNVVTKSASGEDVVAVEVLASMAPDGKPYVKADINGSGVVIAILHDLAYQTTPANLRSITA